MTVVAVDAMGGDFAPRAVVQGAFRAAHDPTLEIILVGRIDEIRAHMPVVPPNVRLHDAPMTVEMGEQPTVAVRNKPQSSIAVGLDLLKRGEAEAFLSFGNTGAVMATALFRLGRVPGVARPALGAVFQNGRGTHTLLLDVGANADCRPIHLLQFAAMGKAYFERVLHHRNPSVSLLNVGAEGGKGSLFAQEAHGLLKVREPHFIGNVEGETLIAGQADVVVTDGFTGNVVVKLSEGVAGLITTQLRQAIESKFLYRVAAWSMRGAFETMRSNMDYQRVGGAPLFGVNGAVIVGHGRADAEAVESGMRLAQRVGESQFVESIRDAVERSTPLEPEDRSASATAAEASPVEATTMETTAAREDRR